MKFGAITYVCKILILKFTENARKLLKLFFLISNRLFEEIKGSCPPVETK